MEIFKEAKRADIRYTQTIPNYTRGSHRGFEYGVTTPELYRRQGRVFTLSDLEPPLPIPSTGLTLYHLAREELRWIAEGSPGRSVVHPSITLDELSPPFHLQFRSFALRAGSSL